MRRLEQQVLQHDPSTCIWRVIEWCQKEEATVRTIIQQDAVGNPPAKRSQQRHVQLQVRLWNLCRDLTTGQKTIAEFLCGEDGTSDSITKIIA